MQSDQNILALSEWARNNGHWGACYRCERGIASIRQENIDLPIIATTRGLVCKQCRTDDDKPISVGPEGTMAAERRDGRTNWKHHYDGKQPLWAEAAALRDEGMTFEQAAATLNERHDLSIKPKTLRKQVDRYESGSTRKRPSDNVNWQRKYDGKQPLHAEAAELRAQGLTWKLIAETLNERHGLSILPNTVAGRVRSYGTATSPPDLQTTGGWDDDDPFADGGEDDLTPPAPLSLGPANDAGGRGGSNGNGGAAEGMEGPHEGGMRSSGPNGNGVARLEFAAGDVAISIKAGGPIELAQQIAKAGALLTMSRQLLLPAIADEDVQALKDNRLWGDDDGPASRFRARGRN
jgi:hypothetical protein